MPSGPKSIHSRYAGRRASGNSRASVTTPMRMSTFSKSGNRSAVRMPGAPGAGLSRERADAAPSARAERAESRPRVVVLEDLSGRVPLLRHPLGAPLGHAHAMAVSAAREVRHPAVECDGKERGLDGLVPDHAPEVVAAEPRGAARAVNREGRHAERGRARGDLDRRHTTDVVDG